MVNSSAGERQTRFEVVRLQVGHLVKDLRGVQSRREEVKDIADANPHAPNARTSPALFRIEGDTIEECCHRKKITVLIAPHTQ